VWVKGLQCGSTLAMRTRDPPIIQVEIPTHTSNNQPLVTLKKVLRHLNMVPIMLSYKGPTNTAFSLCYIRYLFVGLSP
jgi:hypothetical protein